MRKQTALWTMRNGQRIRICDMEDSHLLNTIRFLERWAENRRRVDILGNLKLLNMLNGEQAQLCVESNIAQLEDEEFDSSEVYLTDTIYEKMLLEEQRRGLSKLSELVK